MSVLGDQERQLDSDLYKEALELWGARAQVLMMVEEAGELLQALSKYDRDPTKENRLQVIEELVDVEIMVSQLKVIFDPDETAGVIKATKIKRLIDMVDRAKVNPGSP